MDEAKKFMPPLHGLIIACTGPRDANSQKYVRQPNVDHRAIKSFSVSILGWEDIKGLVQTHWAGTRPDLLEKYFEVTSASGSLAAGIFESVESAVTKAVGNSMSAAAQIDLLSDLVGHSQYPEKLHRKDA